MEDQQAGVVFIWKEGESWHVQQEGNPHIYVFKTKRQAMNKAEETLDRIYGK